MCVKIVSITQQIEKKATHKCTYLYVNIHNHSGLGILGTFFLIKYIGATTAKVNAPLKVAN